jgi:hypothetical protein
MGNPGRHDTKLRTAGEVLIAGFASATLLSLAIAVFRTPPPPSEPSPLPPINTAGWSFELSDWRVLAGLGAIAVVVAVVLVLRSRARFFIVASAIVGGEIGFLSFDVLRFSGLFPQGSWLVEAVRTPSAPVHLALIALAAALFWIDHRRRPSPDRRYQPCLDGVLRPLQLTWRGRAIEAPIARRDWGRIGSAGRI